MKILNVQIKMQNESGTLSNQVSYIFKTNLKRFELLRACQGPLCEALNMDSGNVELVNYDQIIEIMEIMEKQ
ncbi:MAG: hypothetical protein RLZZ181_1010 [Pseudomonadota bacterium]|jgi:hypothetical protein